jgi:hypothetical protein
MRGLVPRIHAFLAASNVVDGRDERGHDGNRVTPTETRSENCGCRQFSLCRLLHPKAGNV